jgi:DNA polymerase-1
MAAAEKLLLLDGTGFIFRNYFALPPLTTRSGIPTNSVTGFYVSLHRLLRDQNPDFIGVAMDLPEPTFRHREFSEYKANRPAPPDDLIEQIPYVRLLCEALRIPVLDLAGFEADDVMGTLARRGAERGLDVVLASTDKDLLQLVDDRIRVLNPVKNRLLDPDGVEDRFGVRPERVADVLALWGDSQRISSAGSAISNPSSGAPARFSGNPTVRGCRNSPTRPAAAAPW